MAALILGLLVSSAKDTYDTKRTEVIQMAAKIAFLDRVLAAYGAEAAETWIVVHREKKEAPYKFIDRSCNGKGRWSNRNAQLKSDPFYLRFHAHARPRDRWDETMTIHEQTPQKTSSPSIRIVPHLAAKKANESDQKGRHFRCDLLEYWEPANSLKFTPLSAAPETYENSSVVYSKSRFLTSAYRDCSHANLRGNGNGLLRGPPI
jgi:hypothetical protein